MSENIRDPKNWSFETKQLHIGQESPDPATDARAVPIYASSSFVFRNSAHAADRFGLRDAGSIYGRLTNPTNEKHLRRNIQSSRAHASPLFGYNGDVRRSARPRRDRASDQTRNESTLHRNSRQPELGRFGHRGDRADRAQTRHSPRR